jgi:hypothetical protein
MWVTRRSLLSGIERTKEIDCTEEQLTAYELGKDLAQNIFYNLSPSDREFIMTGITDTEWEKEFEEKSERKEI